MRVKNLAALLVMVLSAAPAAFADTPGNPPPDVTSAQNPTGGMAERSFRPITLVLINASPNEAIQTLAQSGQFAIRFAPGVNVGKLRPLSVTAREAPFYRVLQQVAFAEDLTVTPSPQGFTLSAAAGASAAGGTAGQPTGGLNFPPAAAPIVNGGFGGTPFGGAPFGGGAYGGGPFGGGALGAPANVGSLGASANRVNQEKINSVNAAPVPPEPGPELPVEIRQKNARRAVPESAADAAGEVSPRFAQPPVWQLQYVLQYAENPRTNLLSPDRVIEGLKTTTGSLQYVAVVSEALTQLSSASSAGPAPSAALTRLRTLLGQAEDLHRQACERERLQTEILVLQTHIPRAAPSLQPLLQDILQRRERDLNALQP